MSRRYLIAVSIIALIAIAAGVLISGVWRIEKLDYDHRFLGSIGVMVPTPPPPAPAGGHKPSDPPPTVHKKKAEGPRQPDPRVTEHPDVTGNNDDSKSTGPGDPTATGPCLENCGPATAPPADPVCGNGSVETGETCDDGNTANGDGCSATCHAEPKKVVQQIVPPTALKRVSGDTDLHPSAADQNMMQRDGTAQVKGTLKVCVGTDGAVTSASMIGTTKYPGYDATLTSAVRGWRYQPVTINGAAIPACSVVTFLYHIE